MSSSIHRPLALPLALIAVLGLHGTATADDWPQWRGPTRDGVWHETGLRETLPDGQIDLRWSVPIGSGYSGPTVADGRVYVTDRSTDPKEVERVHCFDWKTGERIWSHTYDCVYVGVGYEAGPRCSVLVHDGRAYSVGAMGHLFCFDAATGEVLFSHDLNEEYQIDMPIWGIAASPLIEANQLIVPVCGLNDSCVVAFDVVTGEERWHALADTGNYAAPIVVDQAGRRVLVIWTGLRIVGLDPVSGRRYWDVDYPPRNMPLGIATPVHDDDMLFCTGFYDGCILLRLDPDELSAEEVWRRRGPNEIRTDGLQSLISTPFIRDGHIYGVDSYGQLRCLKLADGERIWEDLTAVPKARWSTIHMVSNGDRTWMLNERGELILAELTPDGFNEIDRCMLIKPTREQLNERGGVVWSHPAFAYKHVFARNDEELVCADLGND